MRNMGWSLALFALALVAGSVAARAGEAAGKDKTGPEKAIDRNEVVAKVDDASITRGELIASRRRLAMKLEQGRSLPNNEWILDKLIDRALLLAHFKKAELTPTGAQVTAAIRRLDAQFRQRRASYTQFLARMGLTAEQHAAMLSYEMAKQKFVNELQEGVTDAKIKAEYEAHPQWYDGSRIHLSQIFVDTSNIGDDPEALEKARKKIDKCYAELKEKKDFAKLAKDRSEDEAGSRGGDCGWFLRKGKAAEVLITAAWDIKIDDLTKPIRGPKGWHILKVTEREGAYFTFQGCKQRIRNELIGNKVKELLKELRAKAKIKKML